jgi:hypothetical protein
MTYKKNCDICKYSIEHIPTRYYMSYKKRQSRTFKAGNYKTCPDRYGNSQGKRIPDYVCESFVLAEWWLGSENELEAMEKEGE